MTPGIQDYLDKKLVNIKELLWHAPGKHEMWIELSKTTAHHLKGNFFEVKVDIELKKRNIHIEERAETLYAAIDKVDSILTQELKHYKDKFTAKNMRQARIWKKLMRLSPMAFIYQKGKREREEGM